MPEQTFFPGEVFEEAGGWVAPENAKALDGAFATVTAGATAANLTAQNFGILDVVPEGSTITKLEIGWSYEVGAATGNPLAGQQVKVEPSTFVLNYGESEEAPAPLTNTAFTKDLTALREWTRDDLADEGHLKYRWRVRNNGGAETAYSLDALWVVVAWTEPKGIKVKMPDGTLRTATRRVRVDNPGLTLIHEDPMTSADFEAEWGLYQAASKERYGLVEGGGSPWTERGDGSPRTNFNYRTLELRAGDEANVGGERCELGANESRNGIEGGEGTFMLYQPGSRYKTFLDLWLPGNFPVQTSWYVAVQMKEAQPYGAKLPNESPIFAMQPRAMVDSPETLEWQLIAQPDHNETDPLWSFPATKERWTRFCFDLYYAKSADAGGFVHVTADDRAEPAGGLFVPQHDSDVIPHGTLGWADGDQSGPGWAYRDGQPIPGHLRVGQYRNTAVEVDVTTRLGLAEVWQTGPSWVIA